MLLTALSTGLTSKLLWGACLCSALSIPVFVFYIFLKEVCSEQCRSILDGSFTASVIAVAGLLTVINLNLVFFHLDFVLGVACVVSCAAVSLALYCTDTFD